MTWRDRPVSHVRRVNHARSRKSLESRESPQSLAHGRSHVENLDYRLNLPLNPLSNHENLQNRRPDPPRPPRVGCWTPNWSWTHAYRRDRP